MLVGVPVVEMVLDELVIVMGIGHTMYAKFVCDYLWHDLDTGYRVGWKLIVSTNVVRVAAKKTPDPLELSDAAAFERHFCYVTGTYSVTTWQYTSIVVYFATSSVFANDIIALGHVDYSLAEIRRI